MLLWGIIHLLITCWGLVKISSNFKFQSFGEFIFAVDFAVVHLKHSKIISLVVRSTGNLLTTVFRYTNIVQDSNNLVDYSLWNRKRKKTHITLFIELINWQDSFLLLYSKHRQINKVSSRNDKFSTKKCYRNEFSALLIICFESFYHYNRFGEIIRERS